MECLLRFLQNQKFVPMFTKCKLIYLSMTKKKSYKEDAFISRIRRHPQRKLILWSIIIWSCTKKMHFLETEVDAKPLNIRIYSLHNYDLPNSRHQDVIIENSSTFHNLLPIQKYKVYQCIIFNSGANTISKWMASEQKYCFFSVVQEYLQGKIFKNTKEVTDL